MLLGIILAFIFIAALISLTGVLNDKGDLEHFDTLCDELNNTSYINQNRNISNEHGNSVIHDNNEKIITNGVDEDYIHPKKFEPATIMVLKQTLAEKDKLNGVSSLDELQFRNISDAEIGMFDNYCVLYDLDDDSDYYVGNVNTTEGAVLDAVFAKNNYNGEILNTQPRNEQYSYSLTPARL